MRRPYERLGEGLRLLSPLPWWKEGQGEGEGEGPAPVGISPRVRNVSAGFPLAQE